MYISVADLTGYIPELTLIQLSNDDPRAAAIDVSRIDEAIQGACELVDGYLHGRYDLPLEPVPTMVSQLCKDLTRYSLYQRRPEGADLPKAVSDAYKNALKLLEAIQGGAVHIGIQATQALQPEQGEFHVRAQEKMDLEGY